MSGPDAILMFSYVGFTAQEIMVDGRAKLAVMLQEDTQSLDEVVVISYGTQKKALVTGANLQVDGGDIEKMNTTNESLK